ncbi:MAG: helix-turn-helix transcriptional regulator [Solidesulfovibrio sp.]
MLGLTREQTTDEFVDLSFRVPKDKAELVKRVLAALIEQAAPIAGDGEALTIEEALGPSTPASALRGYRHRETLTQAQLAKLVGVSKQNISDMECGRRTVGKEMAQRLGAALNAPWKRFL